jgi:hypothetical protein
MKSLHKRRRQAPESGVQMGIRAVESAILREAREVFANKSLRLKDLLEWRVGKFDPKIQIEIVEYMPREHVWVCVLREHDRRNNKKECSRDACGYWRGALGCCVDDFSKCPIVGEKGNR